MTAQFLQNFLSRFDRVSGHDGQYEVRCPCHNDDRNSLCIGAGEDGRVLIHCQAGCETQKVVSAVGLRMSDLFPDSSRKIGNGSHKSKRQSSGKIVDRYRYSDERGVMLYEVVRFDPKDFRQRRPRKGGGWTWNLKGVRRVLYRLPELIKADPNQTVFITEGEKDTDRLHSMELLATTNAGGAKKWKDEYNDSLDGRNIVLLPDNDPAGHKHVEQIAMSLRGVAATVKIVELPGLPQKGDISDWLDAGRTAEELLILVDETLEWKPSENDAPEINEADDDPHRLAHLCLEQLPTILFWRQEFYIYSGPVYCVLHTDELKSKLTEIIKEEFDQINLAALKSAMDDFAALKSAMDGEEKAPKVNKVTKSLLSNVVEIVQSLTILPANSEMPQWIDIEPPFPPAECLVTLSNILHPKSLVASKPSLAKLTESLFTINALDYAFDPEAECPQWTDFLSTLWPDDLSTIEALQEIVGYLLLPDTSFQKMFMLIGPKRSGKGTIARVIRGVVGEYNCCAPTLGSLQGDFGLQPLLGKTVAIIGDARLSGRSDASVIVERLLSITGEDAQTVNRKFLSAVTTQLKTKFVLISNELPSLRDASATFPSRVLLLKMEKSFYGKEDRKLTDKLLTERSGILRWALSGWQRLYERGHFIQPESGRDLLEDMESLSSPVKSFVQERCRIEPGYREPVHDVFQAWKEWCELKGRKQPGTEQSFGRDLRAAVPLLKVSQPRIEGRQVRHYEGISLTDSH